MSTTINAWRLKSPGTTGWERGFRADDAARYFVVDTDSHANEPTDVFIQGGLESRYHDRAPHLELDDHGNTWMLCEGWKPQLVRAAQAGSGSAGAAYADEALETSGLRWSDRMEEDDILRMKAGSGSTPDLPGLERRTEHADLDGIDAQVVFPNRGLLAYATFDAEFSHAMCQAWNRWALDVYEPHNPRFAAVPMIAPMMVEESVAEVEWAASQGFRSVLIPCQPVFGSPKEGDPHYNDPRFDPIWAAIETAHLPISIHVATGRDPRAATGPGGALFNLAIGSLSQVVEPLTHFLASGIFERFPGLRLVTVEGGIGWVPWLLQTLDEATLRHHMYVRPVCRERPSDYYRHHCASTFVEDYVGLSLIRESDLVNNVMWSSDYPHHEGSWPHSAPAIERQLGAFSDAERAAIVGLNAAKMYGFTPGDHES